MLVSGTVAVKASRLVLPSEPIHLTGPRARYVSRGGEKLAAALDRFDLDVAGARALDAGSSTGGFTDCLLQHGARSVTALDVGRGQLHERLRGDDRVDAREQTDIRSYTLEDAGGSAYDVITADLSFISVTRAVPMLAGDLARPRADLVVLVKPQFEAGRSEASKGRGIIRDAAVHRRTLGGVCSALWRTKVRKSGGRCPHRSPVMPATSNSWSTPKPTSTSTEATSTTWSTQRWPPPTGTRPGQQRGRIRP